MPAVLPRVSILVLNWNQPELTLDCLASLAKMDYPCTRVIVVDNGSTDDSVQRIRAVYPSVEMLELGSNLGYAEGNNAGIRLALAGGADYLLILNNDTLVAPTMLRELMAAAEGVPDVGMVGPTVYCMDSPDTIFAAGSFIRWWKAELVHRCMFRPAADCSRRTVPERVDFIAGCGVLVSRRAIETAGCLDPTYHLNFEDAEWCVRVRRHGFSLLHVSQAVMWHKVSATLGRDTPRNSYYMTRNALLFFSRNSPAPVRWVAIAAILLSSLRTILAWTLKSRYRNPAFRRRRAAKLLALRDFFLGRFGEMGPDVARLCATAGMDALGAKG